MIWSVIPRSDLHFVQLLVKGIHEPLIMNQNVSLQLPRTKEQRVTNLAEVDFAFVSLFEVVLKHHAGCEVFGAVGALDPLLAVEEEDAGADRFLPRLAVVHLLRRHLVVLFLLGTVSQGETI
jgi:hypothetical protein